MSSTSCKHIALIKWLLCPVLFCTAACNAYLDDPRPTDSLPVGTTFQTADDLEAALIGVYDALQAGHLYGRNLIVLPDLIGGNADYRGLGYYGLERYSTMNLLVTDGYVENTWMQAYRAINQINAILAALPRVTAADAAMTPGRANRIRGECLFCRGLLYFDLVRLFALPYGADGGGMRPGIPYLLTPVLAVDDISYPDRTPVDSVYYLLGRDLEDAHVLLPENTAPGRAGRYTALAVLARVAFQKENYHDAAVYAGEILEGPFQLAATPQDVFDWEKYDGESIFTVLYQQDEPGSGELGFVYQEANCTTDLIQHGYEKVVPPVQLAKVQAGGYQVVDLRSDTGLISLYPFVSADTTACLKYDPERVGFHRRLDLSLARLPEFMLMRAEALARLNGPNQESVDMLNRVRSRALRVIDAGHKEVPGGAAYVEFTLADFSSSDVLIEAIIQERRVELAFEGNYFYDLLRLKRPVRGFPFDTCVLRLPIPQRERDVNKNLVQNPCY